MGKKSKSVFKGLEGVCCGLSWVRPTISYRDSRYPHFSIFSFFNVFENYFCRMERLPGVKSLTILKAYTRTRGSQSVFMRVDLVSGFQVAKMDKKWVNYQKILKNAKKLNLLQVNLVFVVNVKNQDIVQKNVKVKIGININQYVNINKITN